MKRKKEEADNLAAFLRIVKHAENDPELKKKMDEAQRKYGTLTPEDMKKQFTIQRKEKRNKKYQNNP